MFLNIAVRHATWERRQLNLLSLSAVWVLSAHRGSSAAVFSSGTCFFSPSCTKRQLIQEASKTEVDKATWAETVTKGGWIVAEPEAAFGTMVKLWAICREIWGAGHLKMCAQELPSELFSYSMGTMVRNHTEVAWKVIQNATVRKKGGSLQKQVHRLPSAVTQA